MVADHVGDMSKQDLESLVESVVDRRMRMRTRPYKQHSDRPLREIIQEMRDILIKRQPGDPSVVEMIREDRDR